MIRTVSKSEFDELSRPGKALDAGASQQWETVYRKLEEGLSECWDSSGSMLCVSSGSLWWKRVEFHSLSDFEMNDDYCGEDWLNIGIFTRRIHCRKLVEIAQNVLCTGGPAWKLLVTCSCPVVGEGALLVTAKDVIGNLDAALEYEKWFASSNYKRNQFSLTNDKGAKVLVF